MKTFLFLTVVSVFLFVSCNKEPQTKTLSSNQPIQASVSEWKTYSFDGDQVPPYPSSQLKKFEDFDGSLVKLENAFSVLKSNQFVKDDFRKKINDYKSVSSEEIHKNLLKLKGRKIDVIGMEHISAFGPDNESTAVMCQTEITKIILEQKYQIMFTEDFSSDVGIVTKEKIIQDFTREAFDGGFNPKDALEVERVVYQPIVNSRISSSIEIFERHPQVSVVGADYYPVKRIQQHLMSVGTSLNLDHEEGEDLMFSLSSARDIYLLTHIANLKEFSDKKCVIVYGALHVPHLVKLLKSYGASGIIRIQKSMSENPSFKMRAQSLGVNF